MEIDGDVDSVLLQQFSSMGTTDKEVLISQFQKVLGNHQLNRTYCAFFLDMNNWNLNAAIGSFYDFEQPSVRLPSMAFIKDVTIGEGESAPPLTPFIKTWKLQNTGTESWPPGCCLRFVGGEQFGHRDCAVIDTLEPGAMVDVSVEMVSPKEGGMFQGQWRMCTPTGMYFGEIIWVILNVEEGGILGLTQQMNQFCGEFSSNSSTQQMAANPFASPVKMDGGDANEVPVFSSPSLSIQNNGTLQNSAAVSTSASFPQPYRTVLLNSPGQDASSMSTNHDMDSS